MGQWKLQIDFVPGLGIYVSVTKEEIAILLPFVAIYIGMMKCAKGYSIFGRRKY